MTIFNPDRENQISLIYRSIYLYRILVNILFLGKYKARFNKVTTLLDPASDKKITELCFGDIYIAKWCKEHGVEYLGIDLNPHFVEMAEKAGYNVMAMNLRENLSFPKSDVVIMMGSLYHFHDILDSLIDRIMLSCNRLIISEPIKNLASRKDIFGFIARHSTNAGSGEENFRFDENSLRESMKLVSKEKYLMDFSIVDKEAVVVMKHKQPLRKI